MAILLADQPSPILEGIVLLGVGLAILLASVARSRATRAANRVVQLFWQEVSKAGYIWAAVTTVLLGGAVAEVEGLRMPVWLVLALITGVVTLVAARVRWHRQGLEAVRSHPDDVTRPDRPRLVSTTWEVAFIGAAAGAFIAYAISVAHAFGHPIHWVIAGVGAGFGYATALVLATPRFTVRRGAAK